MARLGQNPLSWNFGSFCIKLAWDLVFNQQMDKQIDQQTNF